MKAIVFTRHKLTDSQINELNNIFNYSSDDLVFLTDLASQNINNEQELDNLFNNLVARIKEANPYDKKIEMFGVIPTPLRAKFKRTYDNAIYMDSKDIVTVSVFESWNVNRAKEGEKPSFEHYKFLYTDSFYYEANK